MFYGGNNGTIWIMSPQKESKVVDSQFGADQ
jgi:hypothetical protein